MVRDVNANGEFESSEGFFYAKDHMGSVYALVDNAGTVVQRYNYSAYGRTMVEKTHESDKLIKNPYAYTSREWEQETGDYFNRMRFYNPNTGRWLSPDPIRFSSGSTNFYEYGYSNPVTFRDASGLAGCFYDVSSGRLTCTSDNGQQKVDFGPGGAFSGNGSGRNNPAMSHVPNKGPVPPGYYLIDPTADPNKFNLRPSPYTRISNLLNGQRNGFQLHPGTRSNGCITTNPGLTSQWNQLQGIFSQDGGNNTLEVTE